MKEEIELIEKTGKNIARKIFNEVKSNSTTLKEFDENLNDRQKKPSEELVLNYNLISIIMHANSISNE